MSIQPQGEHVRNAVKWVSDQRKYHPEKALNAVIEQAGIKFDLSPKELEFLTRFVKEEQISG